MDNQVYFYNKIRKEDKMNEDLLKIIGIVLLTIIIFLVVAWAIITVKVYFSLSWSVMVALLLLFGVGKK